MAAVEQGEEQVGADVVDRVGVPGHKALTDMATGTRNTGSWLYGHYSGLRYRYNSPA